MDIVYVKVSDPILRFFSVISGELGRYFLAYVENYVIHNVQV